MIAASPKSPTLGLTLSPCSMRSISCCFSRKQIHQMKKLTIEVKRRKPKITIRQMSHTGMAVIGTVEVALWAMKGFRDGLVVGDAI